MWNNILIARYILFIQYMYSKVYSLYNIVYQWYLCLKFNYVIIRSLITIIKITPSICYTPRILTNTQIHTNSYNTYKHKRTHTQIVDSIIGVYKYSFNRQLEKAREDDVLQYVTLKRDNDLGDINEKMVERV